MYEHAIMQLTCRAESFQGMGVVRALPAKDCLVQDRGAIAWNQCTV